MAEHIFRCNVCGEYTMDEICRCGGKAQTVRPAKFSPDDRYVEYTRKAKRPDLEDKGLL